MSEAALEDFIWENLKPLFDLKPLKRQHHVLGQYCDILACTHTGQLVILELKNQEDRYLVSQMTRYYSAVIEAKPFLDAIDYSQPVLLKAIAPTFHRDNLIDRQYSHLAIEFLQFKILQENQGNSLHLVIQDIDNQHRYKILVSEEHKETEQDFPLGDPPRVLQKILSQSSDVARTKVLEIREKVLTFDQRIRENTQSTSVLYGRGKSNVCAEIKFDAKRGVPVVFLWLPHVQKPYNTLGAIKIRPITARMRIWTNWETVSGIGHVPEGLGRMVSVEELIEGNIRPLKKAVPSFLRGKDQDRFISDLEYRRTILEQSLPWTQRRVDYRSGTAMLFETYSNLINRELCNSLNDLIDLALSHWVAKN